MKHFDLSEFSEAERMLLARDLLEVAAAQYDPPVPPEEIAEIRRRRAALERGETQCIPWEEALAAILKKRGL